MKVEAFTDPFRHWVVENLFDEFEAPALTAAATAAPTMPDAPWVRYNNDCERGKRTCNTLGVLHPCSDAILRDLMAPWFVEDLADLTGIAGLQSDPTLHGAGIHITDPGGWLACHLDYAKHPTLDLERRVNLVLFLNPEWREEWGGAFELWDESARQCAKQIYPVFNRAVIWEAGDLSYHGTQETAEDAPPRVTAAIYYLTVPRPGCARKRALFVPRR